MPYTVITEDVFAKMSKDNKEILITGQVYALGTKGEREMFYTTFLGNPEQLAKEIVNLNDNVAKIAWRDKANGWKWQVVK